MQKLVSSENYLVVRKSETTGGGGFTVVSDDLFSMGEIVSEQLVAPVETNKVVFVSKSAKQLGLGFDKDLFVVPLDSVVCYVAEEGDE